MTLLYPNTIQERYKGAKSAEEVALLRKYVTNGGEIDIERAARSIIDDFRKGRLGKITLD